MNRKIYIFIVALSFVGLIGYSYLKKPLNDTRDFSNTSFKKENYKLNIDLQSFENCRKNRIKDIGFITGKLLLSIELDSSNKVVKVVTKNSQIDDDILSRCIVSAAKRLKFKKLSSNEKLILIPINFK